MKQYEIMFVFDPSFASDAKNVEAEIGRIMQRAGAEIIMWNKWEERKLAYEIKKRKRGCYVLAYFRAEPSRIAGLERDCELSEQILRVLVLRAEGLSQERMAAMYPDRASAEHPEPGPHEAESDELEAAAVGADDGELDIDDPD